MHELQVSHASGATCARRMHNLIAPHETPRPVIGHFEKEPAMAAQTTTRPAPLGAITAYKVINAVGTIAGKIATWNDARMTRNALGKLSDRELDDIGLCRGDIEDMAQRRA